MRMELLIKNSKIALINASIAIIPAVFVIFILGSGDYDQNLATAVFVWMPTFFYGYPWTWMVFEHMSDVFSPEIESIALITFAFINIYLVSVISGLIKPKVFIAIVMLQTILCLVFFLTNSRITSGSGGTAFRFASLAPHPKRYDA